MGEGVPFGSQEYCLLLALLLFARSTDFLSTWVGSPQLILEGNPLAKKLRWKWSIALNLAICFAVASWPLPAIIVATMSVLLAARNFHLAWLMRCLGEERYRDWFMERMDETQPGLFLFCLMAQTLLTAAVGGALMFFSTFEHEVPFGIGMGIVTYAVAVAVYTLLALWRNRRVSRFR